MSNPPNRLAAYRSYNYYHVLVMCDCSKTADDLASNTTQSVWEHASSATRVPGTDDLGRYSVKATPSGGKYCVLVHGATDAAYVITHASWASSTGASAVPGDRCTSIAVEGKMAISEPKGIAFLDQVVKCAIALGVDSSHVVYTLKTFFVGYGFDQGTGEFLEHITDVPPINFITYDVTGSFTEAGGQYEMQFVAVGHGAARLPQFSKAVNGMSITGGSTLKDTMKALEKNIAESYQKYFDCVVDQIKGVDSPSTQAIIDSLRPVKYIIDVAAEFADPKYTVTDQPDQYKNTSGCNDRVQLTFPPNTSIESAINHIMQRSPQVRADMTTGDTSDQVKYEYKIHSGVISEPVGGDNSKHQYTVYYRVERFMTPKTISYEPAFQTLQTEDIEQIKTNEKYATLRRNIIEFDYIYTGKNIDILEFDMKVNMGLAYLQTATLSNTFKRQTERAPTSLQSTPSESLAGAGVSGGAGKTLVEIPVFFGSTVTAPQLTNTQNANSLIEAAYTLTKHASLEVAEATMKIVGNDRLLVTTNRTASTAVGTMSAGEQEVSVQDNRKADFQDWTYVPAYAKVNIKMPRGNDDFDLFTGNDLSGTGGGSTDYARDFWFDGYYYVYGIEHVFDNGEFTQNLQMVGLPRRTAFDSAKGSQPKNVTVNPAGSCYDNAIGVGAKQTPPNGSPSANVGQSRPGTIHSGNPDGVTATTREDAEAAIKRTATTPSNVKAWDTASPEIRRAIEDAANRQGVDVTQLAMIAWLESKFQPTVKANTSSAQGLFQFIKKTWLDMIAAGQIPSAAALPESQRLQARNIPAISAEAGARYLSDNQKKLRSILGEATPGDTYLMHFMGETRGMAVLKADKQTQGQMSLREALGIKGYLAVLNANRSLMSNVVTVGDMRTLAAIKMSSSLKNAIPVVPTNNQSNAKPQAKDNLAAAQSAAAQSAKTDNAKCGQTVDTKTNKE